MAYFSNGTEGMSYEEEYCLHCVHFETCPILVLHYMWNYDANRDETKKTALNTFIPRNKQGDNEKCLMFVEDKSENAAPALTEIQELAKLRNWNAGNKIRATA